MRALTPHRGNKKSQRHSTERRAADPSPFPGETVAILPGQVDNPDGEVEDVSPRKSSRRPVPTLPSGSSSVPSAHHNNHERTQGKGKGKAPAKHDVVDGHAGTGKRKSGTPQPPVMVGGRVWRDGLVEYEKAQAQTAFAARARDEQKSAESSTKKQRGAPELLRPATSRLKIVGPTNPLQALVNHSGIQGLEGNPLYSSASRIEYPDGRVEYRVEFNVHRVKCTSCRTWFANGDAYEAHYREGRCPAFDPSDQGTGSDAGTHDETESDAEDEHEHATGPEADAEEGARSSHHPLPTRLHITSGPEDVRTTMTELITPHADRHGRFYADKYSAHAPLRPHNIGGRAANYAPARQSRLRHSVSASDLAAESSTARNHPRQRDADENGRSLGLGHHDDDEDEAGYPSDHSMDDDIIRPPRHRRPRRVDSTPAVARHPPSDDEDAGAYYDGGVGATAGGDLGWIL